MTFQKSTAPERSTQSTATRPKAGTRWLLLTLLLLPATWPLWLPHLQATHDGVHHLARFYELHTALAGGTLYPRWFPHMAFLYGFPVLHYYAPLTYYLGEIVILLGGGVLAAFEWTLGIGLLAAGWSMYYFARRYGERVGWLAALLYAYWPYHLSNGLVRGAQAELWAMAWVPLLLAAVHSLAHAPT
ncbi:MAG: 6-pyruvoyl-tetrahydropterin synthase-related protein, partial [Caldilineaceae bacterium]